MIAALLPPFAGTAESVGLHDATDLSEEEWAVPGAGDLRRREFAAGRACARRALARVGLSPRAIPRAADGSPLWPDGVVGSITHSHGYAAAAVAPVEFLLGLGIDAEPHRPPSEAVVHKITSPSEREHLDALSTKAPDIQWARVLFSAKEAVYKATYPLDGRVLRFRDVTIDVSPEERTFSARIDVPGARRGAMTHLTGRWSATAVVLTTVVIPQPDDRAVTHVVSEA